MNKELNIGNTIPLTEALSPVLVSEDLSSELKVKINTLIWMFAPGSMTLGEADKMSNEILKMIIDGKR